MNHILDDSYKIVTATTLLFLALSFYLLSAPFTAWASAFLAVTFLVETRIVNSEHVVSGFVLVSALTIILVIL